ncbi:MAG: ATP-binding protein, partial [Candidatus Uhrbacteria bacterium]|nr:ATP-binding protein [Candidatus Uhrbacteria bacterium]
MPDKKYTMVIERTIVDDLGVKLYDKVAAVVAEVIANSYDADAEKVIVEVPLGKALATHQKKKIAQSGYVVKIIDDGHGMTPQEAQAFFLSVGKHRREDSSQGDKSRKKRRPVMGRKGLGKLAPFGVCKTIEVRSAGGPKTAKGFKVTHFQLEYDRILKETSEDDKDYHPTTLADDEKWDRKSG